MNGSRIGSSKSRRRIKVAPVTRAVRIALAASAAAFALVGPGTALAQSCVDDAGTTLCDGAFTDPIDITTPDDLTLVIGSVDPTTTIDVDPYYSAIFVSSGGDVSIDNQADEVSTSSGTAIAVYATSGSIDIDSSADMYAYGGFGIRAVGYGDVTIDNTGHIESTNYAAAGAFAYSLYGEASTSNSGTIVADGYYLASGLVSNSYYGDASATNTGDILASSDYHTMGVYATSYAGSGNASVVNDGNIHASSAYGLADGIFANGADVNVSNTGDSVAHGYYWAAGIEVSAYDSATVVNSGYATGITYGTYVSPYSYNDSVIANGIWASAGEGGISIQNDGTAVGVLVGKYTPTGTVYGTANGIYATANGGDIEVVNNSLVAARVVSGDLYMPSYATGIHVVGNYEGSDVTVVNDGAVYALMSGFGLSTGIDATTTGDIGITNSGLVVADGGGYGFATGIHALSSYPGGDVAVANDGSIYAVGYYGGTGIEATAVGAGGSASVTNSDYIYAVQQYVFGYGAYGIVASGDLDASVDNSGTIVAYSGGLAQGATALAFNGEATANNSGRIQVYGAGTNYETAEGLVASSSNGTAVVGNSGEIYVAGLYYGHGIYASGTAGSTVTNSGTVVSDAWISYGILARAGDGDVEITNTADGMAVGIYTPAYYIAQVFGIAGISTAGDVDIVNEGLAYGGARGSGFGIAALASAGDASVSNSGQAVAEVYGGTAIGALVRADEGTATFDNTGTVYAYSDGGGAYGVQAIGATVQASNAGDILADGYSGIGVFAVGSDVHLSSNGYISADADGKYGVAAGIYGRGYVDSYSPDGDVSIATGEDSRIVAYHATTGYGNDRAYGIWGTSGAGDVGIANAGEVEVDAYDVAIGLNAETEGHAIIANSGDIAVTSNGRASGIYALTYEGEVTASNSGTITSSAFNEAFGMSASTQYGTISLANASGGSIDVSALGQAMGIYAVSDLEGTTSVANAGDITSYSVYGPAVGLIAGSFHGHATATNSGSLEVESAGNMAMGAAAEGYVASVVNSGDISVGAPGGARGITSFGFSEAALVNSGDVSSNAYASAYGAEVLSKYGDATATNSGSIEATSETYGAIGLGVHTYNSYYSVAYGDAAAVNSGIVSASTADGDAVGIDAAGLGVSVTNSGRATGATEAGDAFGIRAMGETVVVANSGQVGAEASDTALGIAAYGNESVKVVNTGAISVESAGEAAGIYAYAYGDVEVSGGSGSIEATGTGLVAGIYAYASGDVAVNAGNHIDATGTGIVAGIAVDANGKASVSNSGVIHAESDADGEAYGILASGAGDVSVSNSGTIGAKHPDKAVAVQFLTSGTATFANSGTIALDTTGEGAIIASIEDAGGALEISNTGTMTGAIVTYGGDDVLENGAGGVWNVTNHATDFGAGDDAIVNAAGGKIVMTDGEIHLGSSTEAGNSFDNQGTLKITGESLIDMGTGVDVAPTGILTAMSFSPMAAPNPAAFENNGIIDFVDGSPGDVLTVTGDFGGQGDINLDVNLLNGTSDLLYIDGDVVDGTQQTVNLAVDDIGSITDPTPAKFLSVTGSVADGAFIPGTVSGFGSDNFLDLTVSLDQSTDGGATVFSIGAKVSGLNRVGVLAANVAPGAQTLISSAIGTMRQRAGAQANASDYGMGPWVRFFDNSGNVEPAHTQDFGSAGDFRFEQMNRGLEFGMGFDFDGPVGIGLLLGDADAKQRMKDGSGSDHIEMSSVGVYGTWTAPAFYVDLSFRWMDLDATLMSSAGETRASGNATASNIEAGYTGWNMGGFDIVPQVQYTRSTVDIDPLRGSVASFESGQNDSARGRLGVEISRSFDAMGFSWKPYAAASMVREFDGDGSYTIADTFSGTTSIEGTSKLLEAGIGARIGGFSGTFGVNWSDGGALDSMLGGNLVLRYTW